VLTVEQDLTWVSARLSVRMRLDQSISHVPRLRIVCTQYEVNMETVQDPEKVIRALPRSIGGNHDNPHSLPPLLELGHTLSQMGGQVQGFNLCSARSSRKLENADATVGLLKRVKALGLDAYGCTDQRSGRAAMGH
jgi:hypothetical protein